MKTIQSIKEAPSRGDGLAAALWPLVAGVWQTLTWRLRRATAADHAMQAGRNDGPPDLDELWRDFNRKLGGLFGGRGRSGGGGGGGDGGDFQPDGRSMGIGALLIAGVTGLIWAASGFFVVQEGEQAVVMTFGKYSKTVGAGWQVRAPYPFQSHEVESVTQVRSQPIGRSAVVQATGLVDSSMVTQDENIVDIRFTVQWNLKDVRQFLFENARTELAIEQAAESAVREVVGRTNMDAILGPERTAVAIDLQKSVQTQLDRLSAGVVITNVNIQSVQAPEQVQAAFDDAFRAGADRERLKNEGQAYANDVIPRARGQAARLREESEAHRARVVAQAEGDASRFRSVLAEYEKAPAVTRDRLYIDAMSQVYGNVSKVMVESRNGSNLLYLPLDKLMQQGAAPGAAAAAPAAPVESAPAPETRTREVQRSRDRDAR
jgi:modulator of FtsH protease HflK